MTNNKKTKKKPFDRNKIPPRQNIFLLPIIWMFCLIKILGYKLKIKKIGMKGLKPPFIVLGTHNSFTDFYITPLALFPYRANYVSEIEGFQPYGEWICGQVGCLGTRKFIKDVALVKNIKEVVERNDILVLYPEGRFANVGTNSELQLSVAKLVKSLEVPVVVIDMKGTHLQSPIWNTKRRREAKLETVVKQVLTSEELRNNSTEKIFKILKENLTYDEYKWQYDQKIAITVDHRAEGIEKVLYKCPICKSEFNMISKKTKLICKDCDSVWVMSKYGKMELEKSNLEEKFEYEFSHIPNWYEWQRLEVKEEIEKGKYYLKVKVKIKSLPNVTKFLDIGEGALIHNEEGFSLSFVDIESRLVKTISFHPYFMSSIHTEYNYNGKGQCIRLSTLDNTYYLFPLEKGFNVTKIQFATEYLHSRKHYSS